MTLRTDLAAAWADTTVVVMTEFGRTARMNGTRGTDHGTAGAGFVVAICGDILHSRVARSNILLLGALGALVRVCGPTNLMPPGIERFGVEVHASMNSALAGADIVMMLRLQRERMTGSFVPSVKEYFRFYGLDREKLAVAKPDALVMHPGPMNRGVEIDSAVADGAQSVILHQVTFGIAVRMAVMTMVAGA